MRDWQPATDSDYSFHAYSHPKSILSQQRAHDEIREAFQITAIRWLSQALRNGILGIVSCVLTLKFILHDVCPARGRLIEHQMDDGMMTASSSSLFREALSVWRVSLSHHISHSYLTLTLFSKVCLSFSSSVCPCHLRLECQVTLPTPLPFRDISAPIGPKLTFHDLVGRRRMAP